MVELQNTTIGVQCRLLYSVYENGELIKLAIINPSLLHKRIFITKVTEISMAVLLNSYDME